MTTPVTEIDGPRLAPASGGEAKKLVILVHGYGADGNDLIALGEYWQRRLPEAAFVAPHAPERCEMNPFGYQWFPIDTLTPGERVEGLTAVAPVLAAFIDRELTRHALEAEDLALVGFSQGTMLSLHVGLRRISPVAGILGFSGMLAEGPDFENAIRSKPPVLLVHGDRDELIPPQATLDAAERLGRLGVPVRHHISQGMAHGIAEDGLVLGGEFLETVLGQGR